MTREEWKKRYEDDLNHRHINGVCCGAKCYQCLVCCVEMVANPVQQTWKPTPCPHCNASPHTIQNAHIIVLGFSDPQPKENE